MPWALYEGIVNKVKFFRILLLFICNGQFVLGQQIDSACFGVKDEIPFSLEGTIYYLDFNTNALPLDYDTLKSQGTIYTNTLNIPSRSFRSGFPGITDRFEWFAINYFGYFMVSSAGLYEFMMQSDDGSKLYIDDKCIINNDGVHGVERKFGKVNLKKGLHKINVQYFQGPREIIALQLWYKHKTNRYVVFDISDFKAVNIETNSTITSDGIISLEIASQVLFDFDDAELKTEAMQVLNQIANLYMTKDSTKYMIIEGYTDNKGSEDYNKMLSEKRARNVKMYFEKKFNFGDRISSIGKGEEFPKYPNTTEENMSKNRRVEIKIMTRYQVQKYQNDMK